MYFFRVALPRKVGRGDEIVTPADGNHVGAGGVWSGPSFKCRMERTHVPVIQANKSGDEIVRGLHFQTERILGEQVNPFICSSIEEEEDYSIHGRVNPIIRRDWLFRWGKMRLPTG